MEWLVLDLHLNDTVVVDRTSKSLWQIYRAPVKLMANMIEIDKRLTINSHLGLQESQDFKIVQASEAIQVVFSDGAEFGILDKWKSDALKTIMNHSDLRIEGRADPSAIRTVAHEAQKASDAVVRIDIEIYGPVSLSEEVGGSLSGHKVWLQRPTDSRFPYRNPQAIQFAGINAEHIEVPAGRTEMSVHEKQSTEEFQKTIAEVYNTLKRDKNLNRLRGDIRLKTHLLG